MKAAFFYHSLVSDWNHGNAHFLRGVLSALQRRGVEVRVFEPADSWSRHNLLQQFGQSPIARFTEAYPQLRSSTYDPAPGRLSLFLEQALESVDFALVHEWNTPALVAAVGDYRKRNSGLALFFHDTHHRAITAPEELSRFDLDGYDAVLAYGASLQDAYQRRGWGKQVYVWHEAADTTIFYPRKQSELRDDLVWIGNWGDDERTEELNEFLFEPVAELKLNGKVYGVRYSSDAIKRVEEAGLQYGGWLANFDVPEAFARHNVTLHIPRRPYSSQLPGIPTIRPFEALACGIPLVSAPWRDTECLFRPGTDFLLARDGKEMKTYLHDILNDLKLAESLRRNGLETISARHTCDHRVDQLLTYYQSIHQGASQPMDEKTVQCV